MNNEIIKAGYQGVPGSFSEQALTEYFNAYAPIKEFNFPDFEDILIHLENNTIDYGILPIENTSTGGISDTYNLLRKYDCSIVGERCIRIEHHLLGIQESSLSDIQQVFSHPQAYEQSTEFFKKHPGMSFSPYRNTAESAKYISQLNDKKIGAIGSKKAAKNYNLKILAEKINFSYKNYTRFAIIAKKPEITENCNKISIVITVPHTPGSLYKAMSHFEKRDLNLTKIESRPLIDKPWQYFFYLDLEGNLNNPIVIKALERVKASSSYFKILGNYPAHDITVDEKGLDHHE